MSETVESHTYETSLECRYLLRLPDEVTRNPLLVVLLHGYGSNPADMLKLTAPVVGPQHIYASLQAPNEHYNLPPGASPAAGYNWGIRQHWEAAVKLHHDMLRTVLSRLQTQYEIGPERVLLAGFSQPVGLNYRFLGTYPGAVRGVLGICGGVPRDWEESKYQPSSAAILHIARDEDPFYPVSTALQFPDRLRKYVADVEFHMLPGGHRIPSQASTIVQPWLRRVFGI